MSAEGLSIVLGCWASGRFIAGVFQEAPELAAGGVEGPLFLFGLVVGEKRSSVITEGGKHNVCHRLLPEPWGLMQPRDDLAAERPEVVSSALCQARTHAAQ